MLSTMEKELVHLDNGCFTLAPKELPNYCGTENVGFIWHGTWSDPELEYNDDKPGTYRRVRGLFNREAIVKVR